MKKNILSLFTLSATLSVSSATWQMNSETPYWWLEEGVWDSTPGETDPVILGKNEEGAKTFVYLKDGDNVTVSSLDVGYGKNSFSQLTIEKGAKLSVANTIVLPKQATAFSTGIVEIAGGELTAATINGSGHNTSIGKIKITENGLLKITKGSTLGWLGPVEILLDNSTFEFAGTAKMIFGNNRNLNTTLYACNNSTLNISKGIAIGSNSLGTKGMLVLDSGSKMTVDGEVALGRLSNSSILITNSVFEVIGKNVFKVDSVEEVTFDPDAKAVVELVGSDAVLSNSYRVKMDRNSYVGIHGGKFIIDRSISDGEELLTFGAESQHKASHGDSLQMIEITDGEFLMTNRTDRGETRLCFRGTGKAHFRQSGGHVKVPAILFNASGNKEPVYEISGGRLEVYNINDGSRVCTVENQSEGKYGIFQIVGSSPLITMAAIGTYNRPNQPLFEYCITTNGVAPIVLSARGTTTYLDWINGFYNIRPLGGLQLIHSDTVKLVDLAPYSRKASLNGLGTNTILPPAELWKHPETTSGITGDISVSLNEAARIEMKTLYENGVSRGYVSLPKIKSWAKATVNLYLEPQGDETLESLISSFNENGYSARAISLADYNVAVEIPMDLFIKDSTDEKILFDFNEYSGSITFKANTPKIRALVKKIDFETTSYSTVIIIR